MLQLQRRFLKTTDVTSQAVQEAARDMDLLSTVRGGCWLGSQEDLHFWLWADLLLATSDSKSLPS